MAFRGQPERTGRSAARRHDDRTTRAACAHRLGEAHRERVRRGSGCRPAGRDTDFRARLRSRRRAAPGGTARREQCRRTARRVPHGVDRDDDVAHGPQSSARSSAAGSSVHPAGSTSTKRERVAELHEHLGRRGERERRQDRGRSPARRRRDGRDRRAAARRSRTPSPRPDGRVRGPRRHRASARVAASTGSRTSAGRPTTLAADDLRRRPDGTDAAAARRGAAGPWSPRGAPPHRFDDMLELPGGNQPAQRLHPPRQLPVPVRPRELVPSGTSARHRSATRQGGHGWTTRRRTSSTHTSRASAPSSSRLPAAPRCRSPGSRVRPSGRARRGCTAIASSAATHGQGESTAPISADARGRVRRSTR